MFQVQNHHFFSLLLGMFTIIATQADGLAQTKHADFNGDGYSDLASGLPQANVDGVTASGAIHVIFGNKINGLSTVPTQFLAQGGFDIPGTRVANNNFGAAVAAGDFDGDGYADLAVGAPGYDSPLLNSGAVVLLFGSATGLIGKPGHIYFSSSSGEGFGSVLTAADLNGDGMDEVIVGSPDRTVNGLERAGAVRILRGASSGVLSQMAFFTENNLPLQTAVSDDQFGFSLRAGDFNGDTHMDLAIGAPGKDLAFLRDCGAVYVVYGSPNGLILSSTQLITETTTIQSFDRFGSAIAAGSFGNGSETDIAIGAPNKSFGTALEAGAVFVFYGSPNGLAASNPQVFTQATSGLAGVPQAGDHFGYSLSVGRFKATYFHSPYMALAIGVPDESMTYTREGVVHVLYGSSTGLTTDSSQLLTHADFLPGVACWQPTEGRMGIALGAGDSAGGPESDLVVGGEKCGGEIFTYRAGTTGLARDSQIRGEVWPMSHDFGGIITGR